MRMRIAFFYHSVVSDWNNGNAHFLRGVVSELASRGHEATVFEPENGWSRQNLLQRQGPEPVRQFENLFGSIRITLYAPDQPDLERLTEGMDAVIVHEWNPAPIVRGMGRLRKRRAGLRLLFHDTHHRYYFSPRLLGVSGLENYDGVLAFGEVLRQFYERHAVGPAWTWHEAADTRIFYPRPAAGPKRDLVWIGNGGDGERRREYEQFLFEPVQALELEATVYGVRYEADDRAALAAAGIRYNGWLANFKVPEVFAAHRLTLHIPRRPYARLLAGIPTIRPFEALACGIPLICAPWEDREKLFTQGKDYLMAADSRAMTKHIRAVLNDSKLAASLSAHGRRTILNRHTCVHRVDELLAILSELGKT